MLRFESAMEESKKLAGPLGAVVFVVRKAFEATGASPTEIEQFDHMAETHFSSLSDDDCNTLCDVLYQRLLEDRPAESDGRWYA